MKRWTAMISIVALCLALDGAPAWSRTAGEAQDQGAGAQEQPAAQGGEAQAQKPQNVKEWVNANRKRKGALAGAITGAILGGLLARARGQNVARGAAAGAVIGGVAGYLIGGHKDKIYYSRDEAVRMAHYQPSDGYVIRIEDVRFDPQTIQPGKSATLHIRYLVIGPDPHETIQINCYRGIKYQGSYMTGEQATLKVPNGGGVVESTADFTLPAEAPAGTYAAEALLEDAQGRANRSGTSPLYIAS